MYNHLLVSVITCKNTLELIELVHFDTSLRLIRVFRITYEKDDVPENEHVVCEPCRQQKCNKSFSVEHKLVNHCMNDSPGVRAFDCDR